MEVVTFVYKKGLDNYNVLKFITILTFISLMLFFLKL